MNEQVYVLLCDNEPNPGSIGVLAGGFTNRIDAVTRCDELNRVSEVYSSRLFYWVMEVDRQGNMGIIHDFNGTRP